MPRHNPRRQIDVLAREAERAIQERRDNILPTDIELTQAATVTRSDVDSAVEFFREANAGAATEHLLDGPAGSGERDG
jgi:hypothetical protein